jgi:tetratricopeptide (TPR) repeat protein
MTAERPAQSERLYDDSARLEILMDQHFQRALILFDQSRLDLAEQELRQSLAAAPSNASAHAFLALCLAKRQEYGEATFEARRAIELAPDLALAHYALASVLHERNHLDEADDAIAEAIRLNPEDADFHWLHGAIRFARRDWPGALEAAEEGLRVDAEHISCNNLRAMALVKLGRKAEAGLNIDAALARDPEDALSHANQGWTLLEKGDPKAAMEHFREALRLEPDLEWARQGIVEALKARHLIYYVLLRYFLWMQKLSHKAQWLVIVGGLVGYNVLRSLAATQPMLEPFVFPLSLVWLSIVLLTWIADPLFNLVLRTSRFGRLALSREQVIASNWVGGCVGLMVLAALAFLWTQHWYAFLIALKFAFFIIPVAAYFKASPGLPRHFLLIYATLLGNIGVLSIVLVCLGWRWWILSEWVYFIPAFASPWVANVLFMVRPRY